jgi:hypothetical protein
MKCALDKTKIPRSTERIAKVLIFLYFRKTESKNALIPFGKSMIQLVICNNSFKIDHRIHGYKEKSPRFLGGFCKQRVKNNYTPKLPILFQDENL